MNSGDLQDYWCVISNLACMNHHANQKCRYRQFGTGALVSFVAHGPLVLFINLFSYFEKPVV